MSRPAEPIPGGLFFAFLFSPAMDRRQVLADLSERFGPIALESESFDFDFTRYYDREMGPGLARIYCLFDALVPQGNLVEIKLETNRMESELAAGGGRRVNLDPGVLTANRLVLATGKDAPHRIYLTRGIFADLTLTYESGQYRPLAWTYPDFRDSRTLEFLNRARKHYLNRLKAETAGKE